MYLLWLWENGIWHIRQNHTSFEYAMQIFKTDHLLMPYSNFKPYADLHIANIKFSWNNQVRVRPILALGIGRYSPVSVGSGIDRGTNTIGHAIRWLISVLLRLACRVLQCLPLGT